MSRKIERALIESAKRHREQGEMLVIFRCKYDICGVQGVWAKGETSVEARSNIASNNVPTCPHGKMISARKTMPN